MASEQGYSNQKKKGKAQFKTIHSAGSDSFAEQVIPKYLYNVNLLDIAITGIQDILGTNGQVEFWKVTMVAHNASVGNILQIKTPSVASLTKFEFEILSIIDADNLLILPISNAKPAIGDTGLIKNWVSAASDSDGNPQITIAPAPIKFKLDGVTTDVSKDSVTPANSKLLPTENLIAQASLSSIDGKFTTLNAKDFATSAKQDTGNSSLSSIDGKLQANGVEDSGNSSVTPLGANAVFTGAAFEVTKYISLNVNVASNVASATNGVTVQFSPDGTNWDHSHSTTYTAASGLGYVFNVEFKFARVVYTNGAVAQSYFRLQTIFKSLLLPSSLYTLSQGLNSNMFAPLSRSIITGETTGGGGGYVNVKVNPSGALVADVTGSVSVSNFPATQPVSGSVSVSNFPATQPISAVALPLPSGASTLAEQQTQTTAIGSLTETAPATDTASSGLNGRLQRIAQRLTSLIALFPSSIGTKASAASLSVVLASDQATINTAPQTNSGTITQTQKSVGTSAVRATVSGSAPAAARKRLLIKPSKNNTGAIFFGSSAVTTASGLEIIGPDRLEFLLDASDYYLISDTAGQVVEIIEVA